MGLRMYPLTPTFQWRSVANADYYGLYISELPYGPSNLVYDSEVDHGPVYGPSLPFNLSQVDKGFPYGAEVAVPRDLFAAILERISRLCLSLS